MAGFFSDGSGGTDWTKILQLAIGLGMAGAGYGISKKANKEAEKAQAAAAAPKTMTSSTRRANYSALSPFMALAANGLLDRYQKVGGGNVNETFAKLKGNAGNSNDFLTQMLIGLMGGGQSGKV